MKMKLKLPKSVWKILNEYGSYDDVISAIADLLIDNDMFDHLPDTEFNIVVSPDNPYVSHYVNIMSDNYELMLIDHSPHDNGCSMARGIMFVINNGLLEDMKMYLVNSTYCVTKGFVRRQLSNMIAMCTMLYNYCGEHNATDDMLDVIHSIAALSDKLLGEDDND